MTTTFTKQAQDYLEALAGELEISEARYRDAENSYKSLGDWLCRPDSSLRQYSPSVYVQGSFALGTVIRPHTDEEDYDVDSVCELKLLNKGQLSQSELKRLVGIEIEAYRRARNMTKPMREGRRCWVLDYADGAQFHMDIVPALPNGEAQRILLESYGQDARFANTAIVITDKEHPYYLIVWHDWPRSNPKGYLNWFRGRMAAAFERRRRALAESLRANVEEIPDYRVRTPLQSAIMILKRHRDMMFVGRMDERPISIILTTLAARSYEGEERIADALFAILSKMDSFIGRDQYGRAHIPNPTDPLENFADKWPAHPERERAFYEWLEQARRDFGQAALLADRMRISESLESRIGRGLAKRAADRAGSTGGVLRAASVAPAASALSFGNEARRPTKPQGFA